MKIFVRFLLQAIWILLLGTTVYADVRDELKDLKGEIKKKQQLLKQTSKVETRVSSDLAHIEKNLKEKEASLLHLGSELKAVESGVAKTQKQIELTTTELDYKKNEIARRVSSLYKAGLLQ